MPPSEREVPRRGGGKASPPVSLADSPLIRGGYVVAKKIIYLFYRQYRASRRNTCDEIRIDSQNQYLTISRFLLSQQKPIAFAGPRTVLARILLILQAGNAGQFQAFQEFQGSAAAGGDVGDAVSKAQLLAGCCGVAAANNGGSIAVG